MDVQEEDYEIECSLISQSETIAFASKQMIINHALSCVFLGMIYDSDPQGWHNLWERESIGLSHFKNQQSLEGLDPGSQKKSQQTCEKCHDKLMRLLNTWVIQ